MSDERAPDDSVRPLLAQIEALQAENDWLRAAMEGLTSDEAIEAGALAYAEQLGHRAGIRACVRAALQAVVQQRDVSGETDG